MGKEEDLFNRVVELEEVLSALLDQIRETNHWFRWTDVFEKAEKILAGAPQD